MNDDAEALEEQPMDGLGFFLDATINPLAGDGPPWTHTFRQPESEEVLVEGEDGEMVLVERTPLLPSFTFERRPAFTGILGFLANGRDDVE